MIQLRPYQERGLEETRHHFGTGVMSVLLTGPCGGGKGSLAAYTLTGAARKGNRGAFVVHRREIVKDVANRVRGCGIEPGVVLGDHPRGDPTSPIQICSIQSLLARDERPPADFIVWDEGHHCTAESNLEVRRAYPKARHLLLTATPERPDGTGLGDVAEKLVVLATVQELQDLGFLVPIDVIGPRKEIERGIAWEPIDAWFRHAQGRPTIVFAANIPHAKKLVEAFLARGVTAALVDGKMNTDLREQTLARFDTGEITVLVNVFALTEGWDAPRAQVCMFARGVGSIVMYIQGLGRISRPSPGKTRGLLLDLKGAVWTHGLPDETRVFSLEGRPIRRSATPDAVQQCRVCGACFRPAPKCPMCAAVSPPPKPPKISRAELQAIHSVDPPAKREAYLNTLVRIAMDKGHKPGWIAHMFKSKYGVFPRLKKKTT